MEPEKKSNGAFLGLIIIIVVLVAGGIYIWLSNQKTAEELLQFEAVTNQDSAALDALEQDLNTTDTNIDVDLEAVN